MIKKIVIRLLTAFLIFLIFHLVMDKESLLGINYGALEGNPPIEIIIEIDGKIVFEGNVHPTFIIPELIEIDLKTGWHEIYACTPDLNLELRETFFTPLMNHLDVVFWKDERGQGKYLINSWWRRFYQ